MLHIQDEIKEIIEVPHSIRICDYENPYRETEEQHEMGVNVRLCVQPLWETLQRGKATN